MTIVSIIGVVLVLTVVVLALLAVVDILFGLRVRKGKRVGPNGRATSSAAANPPRCLNRLFDRRSVSDHACDRPNRQSQK
ncbi:hypothetical protein GCT13_27770 [Paraburkholderia sp. CNPSo 3157]|uniref:Uncharacterized protein n=1 Tax=Paraburkholderia franconis TaxID=2654983 RepID=A0A7X1TID5_9BURK|nr:hypothetical protein [Paraburkholderia franconis]MPW20577.1 hypothetical protein [Paraburkholderia franconis]